MDQEHTDLTEMFRTTSAGVSPLPNPATVLPSSRRHQAALVIATALVVLVSASLGFALGHAQLSVPRSNNQFSPGTGPSATFPDTPGPSGSAASSQPSARDLSIARKVDKGLVDIVTSSSYQGSQSAGTGMIISKKGLVLTNNHVIAGATSIQVRLVSSGKIYPATVLGYSLTSDVALLQISGVSNLPTVKLGNSNFVSVKEKVLGVGNAGGVGGTPSVASGMVTGLNQSVTVGGGPTGSEHLMGLIGSSAPIQPGDSGGPLVSPRGKVIAMDTAANVALASFSAPDSPRAFSIPINTALSIAEAIKNNAPSASIHIGPTALLGVDIAEQGQVYISPSGQVTSPPATGATIAEVLPATPAASSALGAGDTITSVDDSVVGSPAALTTIISSLAPGTAVKIGYTSSNGTTASTTVTLGAGPAQ